MHWIELLHVHWIVINFPLFAVHEYWVIMLKKRWGANRRHLDAFVIVWEMYLLCRTEFWFFKFAALKSSTAMFSPLLISSVGLTVNARDLSIMLLRGHVAYNDRLWLIKWNGSQLMSSTTALSAHLIAEVQKADDIQAASLHLKWNWIEANTHLHKSVL